MRRPVKLHSKMRNSSMAERAVVNAYRAKPSSSAGNIVGRAINRINKTVKNPNRRQNIKNRLMHINENTLRKRYKVNKNKAHNIVTEALNREIQKVINFKL